MAQRRRQRREVSVWNPVRAMEEMDREMERNFNGPFFTPRTFWRRVPDEDLAWAPAMDIVDRDNEYLSR